LQSPPLRGRHASWPPKGTPTCILPPWAADGLIEGASSSVMKVLPDSPSDAQRCYREGNRLFPEIRWDEAGLVAAWEKHAERGYNTEQLEDDYVRLACLENQPGAAAVLDSAYLQPLAASIRRVCHAPDAVDSVLQRVREKLLLPPVNRLLSYRAPGSLRAWLKVIAIRTALDMARELGVKTQREVELDERLEALASGPEEQYLRAELQQTFRSALRAAIGHLPERERYALRMHLVAGWNITQIGRVFSVHKATAARWLVSAKEQLHALLSAELARRLGTNDEGRSLLLRSMPSRLDLNLSSIFQTTGVLSAS
jgi:RNA polymerase sigma-70 factor, ECF subfamily